jgi:hypothetical protein
MELVSTMPESEADATREMLVCATNSVQLRRADSGGQHGVVRAARRQYSAEVGRSGCGSRMAYAAGRTGSGSSGVTNVISFSTSRNRAPHVRDAHHHAGP